MTTAQSGTPRGWDSRRTAKAQRLQAGSAHSQGKVIEPRRLKDLLHDVIRKGDRVALEGDNQKQADFLSRTLADCDPRRINNLHMLISSVSRPEHLDLFERGIAAKLDLAYAGPQSVRIAQMVEDGTGRHRRHPHLRRVVRPDVRRPRPRRRAAVRREGRPTTGNLYTGPNTEDTPTIAEAAAFHDGVVIVQANEIVDGSDDLPRVDIPGSWVDYVVAADRPFFLEPLFTRDPRHIGPVENPQGDDRDPRHIRTPPGESRSITVLGSTLPQLNCYCRPTARSSGLKGKIARHWALNPHPTLIPAIESGWVESIHSFGGEFGMNGYAAARPDVFFTGADGSLRSNRVLAQLAGQYAIDMFIGSSFRSM